MGVFDLDDGGAEVGEIAGAVRTGEHCRDVEDLEPCERGARHGVRRASGEGDGCWLCDPTICPRSATRCRPLSARMP